MLVEIMEAVFWQTGASDPTAPLALLLVLTVLSAQGAGLA